jgi:2-polyprenyl-3-methyl-5-hydroxy-6-metoxy-1,4-benzoquinol methylase
MSIIIQSPNKKITYTDTEAHFENGVLRLLSLERKDFDKWLELSEQSGELQLLPALAKGFEKLRPIKLHHPNKNIWYSAIAENISFGVDKNISGNIAWLVSFNGEKYIRELTPPIYEQQYFEGDKSIAGGYGQYSDQALWRLEKATRQVHEMTEITKLSTGNVLDIGSGYGYFRKALHDAKYNHDGIEISSFAVDVAKNLYNFTTNLGVLSDYVNKFRNKFDIVTLWDVIEHIADYEKFLSDIYDVLRPGGFAIIKTPNIMCPEVDVFGPHYHSFKREHLVYFSNSGLLECANHVGFEPYVSSSVSHLLVGFVGQEQTKIWANSLRGSDLIVYLKKK